MGRRTKQLNPATGGARTLAQWLSAVMSMKGESDQMPVDAAVEMIHATPAEDRSLFAREIWRLRREHGTAGLGIDEPIFPLRLRKKELGLLCASYAQTVCKGFDPFACFCEVHGRNGNLGCKRRFGSVPFEWDLQQRLASEC